MYPSLSKVSEQIASENNENSRIRQLSFDAPSKRNPREYPHILYFIETRVIGLHFPADNTGSIFIPFFLLGSVKRFFLQECVSAV